VRFWIFFALLLAVSAPADAKEPVCDLALAESLKGTAISIERVLDESERTGESRGALGTAWFISTTRLVTIGHMATHGKLSRTVWKEVTLRWSDKRNQLYTHESKTRVRIVEVVQTGMVEPLVILEMSNAFDGAQMATIRKRPLAHNESVIAIGYSNAILRYGVGKVVAPNYKPQWQIPLEMMPVFTPGTSGSPVFDCSGEIVAVMQAMSGRKNFAVSAAPILLYMAPQN